jgi:hypothetical protein
MPSPNRPQRILALLVMLVTLAGIVIVGTVRAGTEPAATEVPATQAPPTDPPPTDTPSTEPPPTAEPSEIPTSEPSAEPTEEPTVVPTAEPTSEPTSIPTEAPGTPQVVPTNPPPPPPPPAPPPSPTPREADITCTVPGPDAAMPGATPASPESTPIGGETDGWRLYACTLPLDAVLVDQIQIRGIASTPGWEVILVSEDAPDTPGLLDASNNLVTIRPEEDEREIRFLLGVRRSCTAFPAAQIDLEVVASVGGQQTGTATATVTLELPPPPPPTVALVSVQVDTEREPAPTTIWLAYEDAPTTCGWQLVVTLVDPGDAAWELIAVNGPEGMTAAMADGAVSLLLPPGEEDCEVAIMLVAPGTDDAGIGPLQVEAFLWP